MIEKSVNSEALKEILAALIKLSPLVKKGILHTEIFLKNKE